MDPKKPAKGAAEAAPTEDVVPKEEGVSKKETPPPDPLEQLRNDQQILITALGKGPGASKALDRCLHHLDTIDQLVVPALEKAGASAPELRRTLVWHDLARVLLADLRGSQDAEDRKAKQAVLTQLMTALGRQEAAADSGVFALTAAAKAGLGEIAPKIRARKAASTEQAETQQPRTPALNILRLDMFGRQHDIPSEEYPMARNQNDRSRDDDGRFSSGSSGGRSSGRYDRDDDRSSGSGWHGDSRGHAEASRLGWEHRDDRSRGGDRDDDDDRRYGRGNGGNDRSRDDQGRFASDDDRGGSRGGRYEEDDDRRYSGRSRDDDDDRGRGWHGDPRGHAEASRRGWESRRDDDDDDRGSRGRSSGNDRSRDDQGRFASDDDRGGSRGGRSSGNDRSRDDQGRFASDDDRGDSRGGRSSGNDRSRGDQGRFASDDDRGGSRGGRSSGNDRSRDDQGRFAADDDRGGSRGSRGRDDDDRGHGGWFGDPRGHAEASRRGWENRR